MMISPESGLGDNDAGEGFFFNSTTTESGKEVEYLNSTQFLFVAFLGMYSISIEMFSPLLSSLILFHISWPLTSFNHLVPFRSETFESWDQ